MSAQLDFDIDVDVSGLLGVDRELLVSGRWYELMRQRDDRPDWLQHKVDRAFHNALLRAQWRAAAQRAERRRALRVPLISRVSITEHSPLVACDISLSGLRCSGRPKKDFLDIEFKLPSLQFPVEARAEVVSFRDANVIPLAGLRFVDIDTPYLEHIQTYISRRRDLAA